MVSLQMIQDTSDNLSVTSEDNFSIAQLSKTGEPTASNNPGDSRATHIVPRKISEVWYGEEDRFIVFQAEEFVFRPLPQTTFAHRSYVFSEFLKNPNEPSAHFEEVETYLLNGLTVFKLLGVTAEEAKYFLSALYDAGYFEQPPSKCTIDMAIASLKLSTRYEVQFLRRKALAHLETGYPIELRDWDRRKDRSTFSMDRDFGNNFTMSPTTLHETLAVIDVAYTCNAPWLLPSASYELGMHTIHSLVKHPLWKSIDDDLKAQLDVGRSQQALGFRRVLSFLNIPSLTETCSNGDYTCTEARRKTRQLLDNEGWVTSDPLKMWDEEEWNADDLPLAESCEQCLEICRSRHRRDRQHFWDSLPELYGWPCWSELRALQVTAT
ncbi:hypothetical protein CPC08DRAFT_819328 [Agrocybe pediades]|nr:hypothetical protein CPC08DRAFT_819328 [Agrocybe pediades]